MSTLPTEGDESAGFLDAASGLPLSSTGSTALLAAANTAWYDPSRRYPGARRARDLLDQARAAVAGILDCPFEGVIFTADPGAAAAFALTGYLESMRVDRLLVSAVESLPVLRCADLLAAEGLQVTTIGVDATGLVDPADVATAAAGRPAVACIQLANAEIGTTQDPAAVRAALPGSSRLVADATAVLGRDLPAPDWDALWGDPRMWGGPGGIGVLAVKRPDEFRPRYAYREGHLGLEPAPAPVAAIVAGALALESAAADLRRTPPGLALTDRLRDRVAATIPDVQVLGHPTRRVAHIAMFSFLYVAADELVEALARRGWSVASGASCTSDTRRPHHVLVAIGASTHGSLRVSLPPGTTAATLDAFAADLAEVVADLRREAGVSGL